MSWTSRKLTEREKATIYYHVFGGVEDWTLLTKIANDASDKETSKVKNLPVMVSRWKNSDKIRNFIKLVQTQKADQDAEQRNKGREEERNKIVTSEDNERTETKPEPEPKKIVDYSDPKNRQLLYNRVIANAKDDPKTQLDAAKMFEQIQKDDREAAKAQKQSRVYLPLTCNDCPLYNRQRKKTTK